MTRLGSLALAALAMTAIASTSFAWRVDVDDTPPDARPFAVAVDPDGNVIAAGRKPGDDGDSDALVVKLRASDGALRWLRPIIGTKDGNDVVRHLLTDAAGNAYALGQVGNTNTNADGLVAKLRAQDGQAEWRTEIDGGRRGSDDVRSGVLLPDGDLIVAGASPTLGSTDVIAVWRINGATGSVRWTRRLPGARGIAEQVVAAGTGVYVAANVPVPDADGTRVVIARLDQDDGSVVWTQVLEESGDPGDQVTGLALRGTSHVIVSAQLHGPNTQPDGADFVIAALAANLGNEVWRKTLDGSAVDTDVDEVDHDAARGVAVDAQGNVLATGVLSGTDTGDDVVVLKLRGNDGGELWRQVIDGTASAGDDVRDLAIDAAGNVLVVGRLRNTGTNGDLSAVKLNGGSGAVIWTHDEDGALHAADSALYVAIDKAGQVAVAGRTSNGNLADGFTVVRLSGASGGSWPCGDGLPQAGEACDDANPIFGDGCRNDCTIEVCGDARLDPQEVCDAGPTGDQCCQPDCQPRANGTQCDDQKICTTQDHCEDGVCTGTREGNCPTTTCTITVCDPLPCHDDIIENGTECDDGDGCTTGDRCSNGACVPAQRSFCDDDDPCTADECDDTEGCVFSPVNGFQSVLCVLERRGIQADCRDPLPVRVNAKLDRASSLLYLAYTQPSTKLANFTLKRAATVSKQVRRITRKEFRHAHLAFPCAQAVVQTMDDLRQRIDVLRDRLRADKAS
jgi:cysteine-rich repeat protein